MEFIILTLVFSLSLQEEGEDEEAGAPKKKIKLAPAANNGKAAANKKK